MPCRQMRSGFAPCLAGRSGEPVGRSRGSTMLASGGLYLLEVFEVLEVLEVVVEVVPKVVEVVSKVLRCCAWRLCRRWWRVVLKVAFDPQGSLGKTHTENLAADGVARPPHMRVKSGWDCGMYNVVDVGRGL